MSIERRYVGASIVTALWLFSLAHAVANNRYLLHYDTPATDVDVIDRTRPAASNEGEFMKEALPLGNGRLGAMFSGGVDREYLVFNEITLWMNSTRGADEIRQSGTPLNASRYLEEVRAAVRNEQYGSGENSVESLGTKYLSSKQRLGNYAPFADLVINTGHDPESAEDYQRALDLLTGLGSVSYTLDGVRYSREYLCSHPHDLFVARYRAEGGGMNLTLEAKSAHPRHTVESGGREVRLRGFSNMERDDMEFLQTVRVDAGDAGIHARSDGTLEITGATEVVFYVTGYTDYLPNYPSFKGRDFEGDSVRTIRRAASQGYKALKRAHVADVQELMQRVSLDLGIEPSGLPTDQLIKSGNPLEVHQLYFDYSRYLQISSSRDAPVPSNLQGLWNPMLRPPWNSDYHTDINVQMNYWMVETANLPESFSPFVEWTKVLAESGRHTARETFGVRNGWTIGLNGNIFGFTAQNEHGRRLQQGAHWLAQHLFEHYAFGRDRTYLEKVYPILKGAAEFFFEHLAPWKDGKLVVYPTWSPENFFLKEEFGDLNKQYWGASYDQQLLVNLFTDCIEASIVLDRDADFRQNLWEFLVKLSPQRINSHGQIQEWPEDLDDPKGTHRHLSHLIALHPGRDFSPLTTPKLSEASETVLEVRVGQGGWKGAWRSACWSRLRDGEKALKYYHNLIFGSPNINLLNGGQFQIDGNLGGGAAVGEMLLQSHLRSVDPEAKEIGQAAFIPYREDPSHPNHFIAVVPPDILAEAPYIIDLLPALPPTWLNGKVKGIRARGGFEVDMEWENGRLTNAVIQASKDGVFRIYYNNQLSDEVTLKQGESFQQHYEARVEAMDGTEGNVLRQFEDSGVVSKTIFTHGIKRWMRSSSSRKRADQHLGGLERAVFENRNWSSSEQ